GRVLTVNAGWDFCVLNIGDMHGAAANRIAVVARGGKAIGKVKIASVETSGSIADIIANSFAKGMSVQPGDDIIYTGNDKDDLTATRRVSLSGGLFDWRGTRVAGTDTEIELTPGLRREVELAKNFPTGFYLLKATLSETA